MALSEIDRLLDSRTVAVVGLSPDPQRDSHEVAQYMQEHGYRIVPVNPNVDEVLGERAYARLSDIPFEVDVVDVFRRPEHLAGIVDEAIAKGVVGVWGQLRVVDEEAGARARAAGLAVVMDRCIMVEHFRRARRFQELGPPPNLPPQAGGGQQELGPPPNLPPQAGGGQLDA